MLIVQKYHGRPQRKNRGFNQPASGIPFLLCICKFEIQSHMEENGDKACSFSLTEWWFFDDLLHDQMTKVDPPISSYGESNDLNQT